MLDPHESLVERNRTFDSDEIIPNPEDRDSLRVFLEQRMRRALGPNLCREDRAWTEKKLSERLLGYGLEAHLLAFSYNVPTVTLTALWGKGPGWAPLFPRREKPSA